MKKFAIVIGIILGLALLVAFMKAVGLYGNTDTKRSSNKNYSYSYNSPMVKSRIAYGERYMFAVEIPSFDGDNYKSGNYKFELTGGRTKSAKETLTGKAVVPEVFEIYVSKNCYKNSYELTMNGEVAKATVGGVDTRNSTAYLNLPKGYYVYVTPCVTQANASGVLEISYMGN